MNSKLFQKNKIYAGFFVFVLIGSYQYFHTVQIKYLQISSFKECVDAGFSVLTTYPEKCVMPGKSFVNPLQKKEISSEVPPSLVTSDYKNQSYFFDGIEVTFKNGEGELPVNYFLKQGTTSLYFVDGPFLYDINGDKIKDTIVLLHTNNAPHQRKSYYIAASLSLHNGFSGVNALFVDYSLIDTGFIYKNGEIHLGYTTEEASTTRKYKYFTLDGGILKQLSHK